MRGQKYKIDRTKDYYPLKQEKHNVINYENKNLDQAKKLYSPNYNNNYKNKTYLNKTNKTNYNNSSKKNKNKNFKQMLNNYMNDYEKLKRQNKIPKVPLNDFSYQEFEVKKKNIKEIFNNFMNINGEEEFNDTNQLIDNLPDDKNYY